jgi:intracellular sulfur oxidation DsrE/DsrF family protein
MSEDRPAEPLRVVLHAPTEGALARARSNLRNLLAEAPDTQVRIVANADGVAAALAVPDADADRHLLLCANTLRTRGLEAPAGLATVPAAVHALATLQRNGWLYIRA